MSKALVLVLAVGVAAASACGGRQAEAADAVVDSVSLADAGADTPVCGLYGSGTATGLPCEHVGAICHYNCGESPVTLSYDILCTKDRVWRIQYPAYPCD